MKNFSLFLVNILLLVGFFRVFKSCSHADDLARAGHVRNLKNSQYVTSYSKVGNYAKFGKYSKTEVLVQDVAYTEKLNVVEQNVDDLFLLELEAKHPELSKSINSIEVDLNTESRFRKIDILREKYLSESEKLRYQDIFERAKQLLDLKHLYHFTGNELSKEEKVVKNDSVCKINGIKLKIPKGYQEVTSIEHPMVKKVWMVPNEMDILFVSNIQNLDSAEVVSTWKEFKLGKDSSDTRPNIFIDYNVIHGKVYYRLLCKNQQAKQGVFKLIGKNKNYTIVDVETQFRSEDSSKPENTLNRILVKP